MKEKQNWVFIYKKLFVSICFDICYNHPKTLFFGNFCGAEAAKILKAAVTNLKV